MENVIAAIIITIIIALFFSLFLNHFTNAAAHPKRRIERCNFPRKIELRKRNKA
jgi:hypothetical protein